MTSWNRSSSVGFENCISTFSGFCCMPLGKFIFRSGWWILVSLYSPKSEAVIFYSTGDPNYNTTPPSGTLAGSGWEYQGYWVGFLGTVIGPQYFLTAKHVGGAVGDKFILGGVEYSTTAFYDDEASDLRICRVSGLFPAFAVLNTNTMEWGRSVVVFGRGTQRGSAVTTTRTNLMGEVTVEERGWRWGVYDGVMRWGENVIQRTVPGIISGGRGDLVVCTFDANGGPNECHLSSGDSGGGLFIQESGVWQLAGINLAADGTYKLEASGEGFNAALYDEGGVYKLQGTNWLLTPDLPFSQAGSFFATRISARVAWIRSIIEQPAPDTTVRIQTAAALSGPFIDAEATIDHAERTIRSALSEGVRFYRLRSDMDTHLITSIRIESNEVVLNYE